MVMNIILYIFESKHLMIRIKYCLLRKNLHTKDAVPSCGHIDIGLKEFKSVNKIIVFGDINLMRTKRNKYLFDLQFGSLLKYIIDKWMVVSLISG